MPAPFHDRLVELAQVTGHSLSELGLKAKLSKGTVNGWERKSRDGAGPNGHIYDLIKLADYYKISLDWLMGRADSGGPKRPGAASETAQPADGVDSLKTAKDAATAVSFELHLPLATTWQAAFNLVGPPDDDRFREQIRALAKESAESEAAAGFSAASEGTRYPVRRRANTPK